MRWRTRQVDNRKRQHRFKPIAHPNAARPVDYRLISRGYEDSDVQKICFLDVAGRGKSSFFAAYGASSKGRAGDQRTGTKRNKSRPAADEATRRYLMYIIMPVWSLAGFLDWLWHRQTKIETTSGAKESVMHLLMMAEAGAPT